MTLRIGVTLAVVFVCVGCGSSTPPTAPTPPETPTRAVIPTNLLLTATPDRLPPAGGNVDVRIRLIARTNGNEIGVPGALVKMTSTEGLLSTAEVTTNDAGEAVVRWTSTTKGTVIARHTIPGHGAAVDGSVTIAVDAPELPTIPPTFPPPAPSPTPQPPVPTPPTPLPDVPITLAVSEPAIVGRAVTLTAIVTPPAGSGTIRGFEWDFGDGATLNTGLSVVTHTYSAEGTYTARVTVRMTDWANGTVDATVAVGPVPLPPPPALSVTLAANAVAVTQGTTVNFTASHENLQASETIVAYQWDLDGNGTFEGTTTTVNTRAHSFATAGIFIAKVKILTSTDRTAEGTLRVVVTN